MAHRRNQRRHRGLDDTTLHGVSEEAAEVAASAPFEVALPAGELVADAAAVREAKVARARALIADPGYPPKGVLDSVANLLAGHLRPENTGADAADDPVSGAAD